MKQVLLRVNEELRTYRANAWKEFNATMNYYYKNDICRESMVRTAKTIDIILAGIDRELKKNNELLSVLP